MKSFIVVALCFAAALAAPPSNYKDATILKSDLDNIGTGEFHAAHETSDGFKAESQGTLINPGQENAAVIIRGAYSYIGDDGQTYSIQYTADENGYHPQGAHLPVAPQ